ncbi:MAG TPA: CocE/NonD family hydrolase [Thermoleophilia bacterium]|nr:CocE/NonD family hydrolase [Thermoleophilia bacterium]
MTVQLETLQPAPVDSAAEQVMVAMRDRVHLATDVYLPAGSGPHPAVLVRLPYDKAGRYTFMPMLAPHITERGYAFVVQDVRGKFRSGGETKPFIHEVEDGYDTLEWLVAQPWSNGDVGMFGDSYYGFTQWAAVASGHPALKAIVPRVTSADLAFLNWSGPGVIALYGADYLAHYWADQPIHFFEPDWSHRPLATIYDDAFAAIGARSWGFDQLIAQQTRGVPVIDPYRGSHPFDRVSIPVLHGVGWFDNLAPDSMRDYTALTSRPDKAALQYLDAASVDHENYRLEDLPYTPDQFHDDNDGVVRSMIPWYLAPSLGFFDAVLQGRLAEVPRVHWHLGNVGWRDAVAWPPAGARERRLYLAQADRAGHDPEGGLLLAEHEAAATEARWPHDPGDLVPSTVEDPFSFLFEYPDERTVETRPDVVTFTTEPVAAPLDLVGPAAAYLRVATTGPSMHLFVKLLDVAPDGAAHMLTRGQTQVDEPDPDRLERVDLNHLGYRLLPGHSLRLQVASSDFPLYLPHPGTDENPWLATAGAVNEQRLLTGGDRSSYLRLTVLPA